jgi:PAS domain S-box-containing protein
MVATAPDGRFLQVNPAYCRFLGYTEQELLRLTGPDVTHPDDREATRARLAEAREGSRQVVDLEKRYVRKNGTTVWAHVSAAWIRASSGKDLYSVAIVQDITTRKRAEEAERKSSNLLHSVLEGTTDAVFVKDRQGRYLLINPVGARWLGRTPQEIVGKDDSELLLEHEAQRIQAADQKVLTTDQPDVFEGPVTLCGKPWTLLTAKSAYHDDQGNILGLIGVARDIADRKRAEEKTRRLEADLVHVARTSTMGEMAATLAHELNQPLAAIANYTEGCQNLLRSGEVDATELGDALRHVGQLTERAGKIIQRIRRLVHKGEPHRSTVDVNDLVREIAGLVELEARQYDARVSLALAETLPVVLADQIQIQQVILNLARNGLEAMEETGPAQRCLIIGTTLADPSNVEVMVRDLGHGLPAGDVGELFEPFFTTKPRGLGMGLAISRTIIESHQGRLWAEPGSQRSGGATIRFSLPVATAERDHGG